MKKVALLISLLFFVAALAWYSFVAPELLRLPQGFNYQTEVLSLDNFYDEEEGRYLGDQRSVTRFSYDVIDEVDDVYIIDNVFSVQTPEGDPIFSTSQQYGINPVTQEHVPGYGNRDRKGYLFAPRNLKEGEPFTYWHINYDGPAELTYVGKEVLSGVETYHYESFYEGVPIDQTENLSGLPGVPEERGIIVEPHLELWIEPITGYLVKYQDDTIAYYYDQETKEKIAPWNHFKNSLSRSSIANNAEAALSLRQYTFNVQYVIPFLLFVIALSILLWGRREVALGVLVFGIIMSFIVGMYYSRDLGEEQTTFKIGIAWWVEGSLFERNLKGFKDALTRAGFVEGHNIEYVQGAPSEANSDVHRALIRSYIDDEKVDLIYSLTTPGTLIAKEETQTLPIVFSVVTYPQKAGIVTSLQNSGNNLVGSRNWVASSDQLATFRTIVNDVASIGFIHRKDEPNSEIQYEEMRSHAETLGIDVIKIEPAVQEEIVPRLYEARSQIDSLYLSCDTLVQTPNSEEIIINFAFEHNLPSFTCGETGVEKGLLVGTVADFFEIGRLAGEKAALILEGASPSSLETSVLSRPFVYVNLDRAEELGLVVPQDVLTRAKGIIQKEINE
ncbi:hypothetical protein CL654_00060 [bacterium]|nr:hypothetical protein [bacterium]|tara:strand:+ start:7247 stop:9091 length:1845 start_codon:yes stop_codon:yes gene_type:complete